MTKKNKFSNILFLVEYTLKLPKTNYPIIGFDPILFPILLIAIL